MPFLTLDAEHAEHSGTVLIVCADPRMVAGANPAEPSRVQQLVSRIRNDPCRSYGLSPHVLAVTCPPRIIGNSLQQRRFVEMHAPVLIGATNIIVEAHNGCAGLAYFDKSLLEKLAKQGSHTPYFDLQQRLLLQGTDRFARRVASLTKRGLVVEANYVDFSSDGVVADVTNICTIQIDPR